ncbi:hypothetical protein MPH_04386 [Macrophomina phaseolina MS6]|uniref:Uncharacterized protein n=1 Tax=Macrophomina phaseolina (strain MS6) TaxID=1126212 RepID=K2SNL2_MACPH|nr:hypothetical protein MPH_04386 [Macrophomina phaseolina MS6]
MSTRQISDTINVLQTAYGANGQTRPIVAMPGRVGSLRRNQQPPARAVQQDPHESPRASYISLSETEYTTTSIQTYPTATDIPQNIRPPPQAARLVNPRYVETPPAGPQFSMRDSSSSVVSFLNQNGVPRRQPSETTVTHVVTRSNPLSPMSQSRESPVSLDRGYFNSYLNFPDPKESQRYNGLSWHVNKNSFIGGLKDIPERMSSRFSRRSLPTADSNISYMKGGSGFDKSVEDLTLLQRARKVSITTILLAVIAAIFIIEECVIGAVWALVLSERSNGMDPFAREYFGSKAMNVVGSAIAALVGLTIQWFLYPKLARSRIALQLWSFILIFLTYMGCCIASGVAGKLEA